MAHAFSVTLAHHISYRSKEHSPQSMIFRLRQRQVGAKAYHRHTWGGSAMTRRRRGRGAGLAIERGNEIERLPLRHETQDLLASIRRNRREFDDPGPYEAQ